ncbi:MAG: hypothetical protein LC102_06120 [Ignavibacteriales bacterium]|jgi:D-alanyl-lipoteichoic acid acyltransferase DltB (MBOAT superfamily)|nr:Peptidoglycan O-acetyltransferase [Ignavibacteriaceae bacterium]MBZ0198195.1 hypothetical protein [Ignavibacteriaceae bacterium]MCZ2142985.1 hypothetical protein [Ignavibacteriales bacterium]OQY74495.1 MAG: hypothetical protein B6D45_06835 [Ignavibacteriales bacterium UTCHB3]WKZ73908.1 MAG: MBOAT family O-acyltransferase [Ignavibacteriaceae bacterium]
MLTLSFIGFLIISLIGYWALRSQKYRVAFLIITGLSYIFHLDIKSGIFVIALTVLTWFLGNRLKKKRTTALLSVSVVLVVTSLLYFKYSNFFFILLDLKQFIINEKIFLPLGISYITFKHISYLADIYWEKIEPGSFLNFLLYSAFFPIFLAGPIERFERFEPQLKETLKFKLSDFGEGYKRIAYGIFKKFVIADGIGILLTREIISSATPGIPKEITNLILFSFQIYFDFAAYSDIAIGSSRFFGIKIMENFNYPYLSPNIAIFWNNWHISLSEWLRDYIFYPLSFALRRRKFLNYFTPVVTMFVCGLWHGASTGFIIWGLWHGLGLFVYQFWSRSAMAKKINQFPLQGVFNTVGVLITFTFITIGWLWFR